MSADQVVLALYPNTRGFGYACVKGKRRLLEMGLANIRPADNVRTMDKMMAYIDYFRPALVLTRDPAGSADSPQGLRAQMLFEQLVTFCRSLDLPVYWYSREQMREVFAMHGITSKHGIAEAVASRFNVRGKVPRPPKVYERESYHMAKFDSIALVVTHYYLTE